MLGGATTTEPPPTESEKEYIVGYELTEEQRMLQEMVRRLAKDKIAPGAAERDEKAEFPWDVVDLLRENGLFGADFPEEFGGSQMGFLSFIIAVEELAKVCASSSVVLLVHELGTMPIFLAGNPAQKSSMLPQLASGEALSAFALTEPGAGSDVAGLRTRAVRDGDSYVLDGRKVFISHGDVARYLCVAAKTDTQVPGHKGMSIFVVEQGTPGLSVGKKENKMGIRASSTVELIFEQVRVPAENLLAQEGTGFNILMKTLDFTRPAVAAQALGIAEGALDFAVGYAKGREQFGKPIFQQQGLAFLLAEMTTQVMAARELVYKTASLFETAPKDLSRLSPELIRYSSACKNFASDVAMRVTTDAVQVLGGYGYIREYPVERMMRDAKITQIYEGTSQVQKIVIAHTL